MVSKCICETQWCSLAGVEIPKKPIRYYSELTWYKDWAVVVDVFNVDDDVDGEDGLAVDRRIGLDVVRCHVLVHLLGAHFHLLEQTKIKITMTDFISSVKATKMKSTVTTFM